MSRKRVVVLGSSFAGLTAPLERARYGRAPGPLGQRCDFERFYLASRKRGVIAL